ncbi:MAG: DUF2892 domain-containing protein [Dehalococcoidia bacterium]
MSAFIAFMNGPIGRIARIVLGLVLMYVGIVTVGGVGGYLLAALGIVPIAMGATAHCLVEFVMPSGGRA